VKKRICSEVSVNSPGICGVSHTQTHPFNGPFFRTTRVSRYQKGKTNLDFTEARDSEWQWHQLGHMQVCILLQTDNQTDNHASTPPLKFFYRPDALLVAQPTASKHWRHRGVSPEEEKEGYGGKDLQKRKVFARLIYVLTVFFSSALSSRQ